MFFVFVLDFWDCVICDYAKYKCALVNIQHTRTDTRTHTSHKKHGNKNETYQQNKTKLKNKKSEIEDVLSNDLSDIENSESDISLSAHPSLGKLDQVSNWSDLKDWMDILADKEYKHKLLETLKSDIKKTIIKQTESKINKPNSTLNKTDSSIENT